MPEGAAPAPRVIRTVAIHQDEVLTGEAVALDIQPIGFFLRALGALIDVVVAIGAYLIFFFTMTWLMSSGLVSTDMFPPMAIAMVVIVTVVIPTAVETMTRGRSLGRLAVGGRIVRTDGGASGFRQAFIRAFVGLLEIWMSAGSIALLVGAFTPQSQRLGDLIAGTYSERTRAPQLPPPAPPAPPVLAGWATTADVARLPDRLGRRISQFVRQAEKMAPHARTRTAASLASEAMPFVSPLPAVDAETLLRGVVAVRRDRELRALQLEEERVRVLTSGRATGRPR